MNLRKFQKHLRALYKCWFEHRARLWGGADVLVISTAIDVPNPKSTAFFSWLLGYNLPSTTGIFTPLQIHLLCADYKKATHLEALRAAAFTAVGADLTVHSTFNSYHGDLVDEVLRMVIDQTQREVARCSAIMSRRRSGGEGEENEEGRKFPVITAGCIVEEPPEWESLFVCGEAWKKKKLATRGFELVWKDATLGFSRLARIKGGRQDEKVFEDESAAPYKPKVLEVGEVEEEEEEEEGVADELEGSGVELGVSDEMERLALERAPEVAGVMEDMAATATWEKVPGCEGLQEEGEEIAKKVVDLEVGGEWVLLGDLEF